MDEGEAGSPIVRLLSGRREVVEILLVAVLLAFAISVLASGAISALGAMAYVLAAVIAAGCCIYIGWRRLAPQQEDRVFEGLVVYDPSNACELIEVPGYRLSQDLAELSRYAFAERPGLLAQWKAEPLNAPQHPVEKKASNAASHQLILELLEYIALQWLSLNLSEYFNIGSEEKSQLTVVEGKDIPQVLMTNRFLALFTQPLKDRLAPGTSERMVSVVEVDRRTGVQRDVLVFQGDKYYYDLFELILPSGSKVRRESDGTVVIDGSRVQVRFAPMFDAYHEMLPDGFAELYLRRDEQTEVIALTASLRLTTKIKTRALFARRRWNEHGWIASFTDELQESFSSDSFFARIQWPVVEATTRSVQAVMSSSARAVSRGAARSVAGGPKGQAVAAPTQEHLPPTKEQPHSPPT